MVKTARKANAPLSLVEATVEFNDTRKRQMAKKIIAALGGKVAGKIVETATRTVSADGKTLTIVTKGNLDGTEYSSTQVYEKQ